MTRLLRLVARLGPWLLWLTMIVIGAIVSAYLGMAIMFAGLTLAVVLWWRATRSRTMGWSGWAQGAIATGMLLVAGFLALLTGAATLTYVGVIPEPPPRPPQVAVEQPESVASSKAPAVTPSATIAAVAMPSPSVMPSAQSIVIDPPGLTLSDPEDGARVTSPTLAVEGTAPSGADIVRDAGFFLWGHEHFHADDNGDWSHTVELEEGDNQLTFWLDNDSSKTVTVNVRYEPIVFEQVTIRGTGTESEPTTRRVRLPAGDYKLWVQAEEPFQPGYDFCGVTVALYDEDGNAIAEIGESPEAFAILSDEADEVAAGDYELWAYIGCPWVLNLTQE